MNRAQRQKIRDKRTIDKWARTGGFIGLAQGAGIAITIRTLIKMYLKNKKK